MKISKSCNLIMGNLFFYDFRSCYYNILKNIGWDLSNIEENNKELRNIQLGLLQKDNPKLGRFLNDTASNLVSYYITINNLSEEDIIIIQKDGIITSKKLDKIDVSQPIELRGIISKLILSPDRKKFISIYDSGDIDIKGVSNKTEDTTFYNLFKSLDYSNKKNLIKGIESIRQNILDSKNIYWFIKKTEDDMYMVPIIGEGDLKISKSSLLTIDLNEVDKNIVWESLVWPFCRSILIHCHG